LTESLALRRLSAGPITPGVRDKPVAAIRGIDVAEHPWKEMMAGRKPRPEPLASLVPADNWYFSAQSLTALAGAAQLIDRWGGNVLRPIALHDRDLSLRQRYEQQLCLPLEELSRTLDHRLVKAIALTGNDLFFEEGSDVTVLIETSDRTALQKALRPFEDRV